MGGHDYYGNHICRIYRENKGYYKFEFIPKTVKDFEINGELTLMAGESVVLDYETIPEDALADKEKWTVSDYLCGAGTIIEPGISGFCLSCEDLHGGVVRNLEGLGVVAHRVTLL